MSGYASYDDALNPKYDVITVPLRIATESSIRHYGRLVHDYDTEDVRTI